MTPMIAKCFGCFFDFRKKMELLSMFYSGVTNGGYGDGDVSSLFSVRSGKDFRRDHCLY